METIVEKLDVWAGSVEDKPGDLARVLRALEQAGADLDCVIARRNAGQPGKGDVFVTPLRGDREVQCAADLGFNVTNSVHSVRLEGDNKPGLGADITEKIGGAGINMRGMSAAVVGPRYVLYMGFDSAEDADKAVALLKG